MLGSSLTPAQIAAIQQQHDEKIKSKVPPVNVTGLSGLFSVIVPRPPTPPQH